MRTRLRIGVAAAGAVLALTGLLAASAPPAPVQSSAIIGILNRYEAGHFDAALAGMLAVPDISPYMRQFQESGTAWVTEATDPEEAKRRRLLLATVILEIAHGRLQEDWADLRGTVEWACQLLAADPPGPEELLWQRAAMAVVQGAYDWRFLTTPPPPRRDDQEPDPFRFGHAAHVQARFPDEPRFALAEVMILESGAPREPLFVPAPPPRARRVTTVLPAAVVQAQRQARRAIDGYGLLLAPGDAGAEARLRMGYLHFRLGEPQAALDAFAAVAAERTADRFVRYLGHYFTGRVYDRRPLQSEVVAAYRRALEIIPGAQSAALALATALFEDGRPDDAYAVIEDAAAVTPAPDDPWRIYGYGDLRFWPDLVGPLRAQVTR